MSRSRTAIVGPASAGQASRPVTVNGGRVTVDVRARSISPVVLTV